MTSLLPPGIKGLNNLLAIFAAFEQIKNSLWRNSVTYGTSCHAINHFVFWYHHVTYRMPCHSSGHLVIYCECYGFKRAFFTFRWLLPYTPSCWFQCFLGSWQFNLRVSWASCWSSKKIPGPTIRLNHNNPQNRCSGRFYLRVMAGLLMKNLLRDSNSFHNRWACQKLPDFIC